MKLNYKNNILLYVGVLFVSIFNSSAQNHEKDVKEYFKQYLNNRAQLNLINKSLPSLEQCRVVFKDEYTSTYFKFVSNLHKQINAKMAQIDYEEHIDLNIDSFNTNDLKNKKSSYTGGMDEYIHVFKPNIIFHRVTYLFENGSQSYNSIYKFFVNINGNWVFFANPGILFEK